MRRWQYFLRPRKKMRLITEPLPSVEDCPMEILDEKWLAELFDAKRVEVYEKDNGDFLVCVEYYPNDFPYAVPGFQFILSGEVVRKYGLVESLLVLAHCLRAAKQNYQKWKRKFLPEEY